MNELNCRLLGAGETFVYAFAGAEDAEALRALLPDCTLIAMDAADWNRQLSPWPAPAIFRGRRRGVSFRNLRSRDSGD